MTRVRADHVLGDTDALLGVADTTLSSPELARLPVVTAPDIAAVTLYDDAGTHEIVHVTEHLADATTATVARGQEGSTAVEWASGTTWLHGPTTSDFGESIVVVEHGADNSVPRPAHPKVVYWLGTVEPLNAVDADLWSEAMP